MENDRNPINIYFSLCAYMYNDMYAYCHESAWLSFIVT